MGCINDGIDEREWGYMMVWHLLRFDHIPQVSSQSHICLITGGLVTLSLQLRLLIKNY